MVKSELLAGFRSLIGKKYVLVGKDKIYRYTIDHSSGKKAYPFCVLLPNTAKEVSLLVSFCSEHHKHIRVRGGGSAVSGGFMANGSEDVIISLERLNRIIEINNVDRFAIIEAGVITQDFQNALAEKKLWFPQNISSASMSFIGGNIALSSGSPKSLKYGGTKNFVLNLEVVLPDGTLMWTGKNIRKNASGYNLTQLFVGSEGTLGIVTKAVIRVIPPKKEIVLLIAFKQLEDLFRFISDFFTQGFSASSLEFLDKNACDLGLAYLNRKDCFGKDIDGLLWLEFESDSDSENLKKVEKLNDLITRHSANDALVGQSASEIQALWECRHRIGEAALNYAVFRDLDLVVPRSKIEIMYESVTSTCRSLDLEFIVIGHMGDGNFHINIFRSEELSMEQWEQKLAVCSSILFKQAVDLGGDISGEHGIGSYNKFHFNHLHSNQNLEIMKGIKKVFDPKKLLNAGNIFFND